MRFLQYVDRPTPLTDVRDGAADWWRMFGAATLAGLGTEQRERLRDRADRRGAVDIPRDKNDLVRHEPAGVRQ